MAKNSYQNLIIFAICLHGRNILFPHGIEQCFLMLVISNILSLATIARLFLRFPAQKNDNMADSSRETSALSKKKKKKKRLLTDEEKEQLITSYSDGVQKPMVLTSIDEEMGQFEGLQSQVESFEEPIYERSVALQQSQH